MRVLRVWLPALLVWLATPEVLRADEPHVPCQHRDPLRQPFFGDLHVHTRWSLDASTQGTRTTPEQAYRFARGEPLGIQPWDADGRAVRTLQLERPLDFAAVTDHSELFGEVALCNTPGSSAWDAFTCRVYRGWPRLAFFFMSGRGAPRFRFCGGGGQACLEAARGPWQEMRAAAEAAYDRSPACRFTAFNGYEWTASGRLANNLHRNVIFANANVPALPASAVEQPAPEDLWGALERECRSGLPGCDALVIPHNSNLSGGQMFDAAGLDAAAARLRARSEPLVEIMQHKGDSECRVGAGTSDEHCGFEKLPYDSFMGRFLSLRRRPPAASNFARSALGAGLELQVALGANPFAFGLIASTDTHLGTPGLVAEAGYPGHGGAGVPIGEQLPPGLLDPIEYNPGGLAVVWAEENTRESLFAALARREVYGTSGPRIALRVFGGWALPDDLCSGGFAVRGYAGGVPMGALLPARPEGAAAPQIALQVARDPGTATHPGVGLERAQLIKLWVGPDGRYRERVVDVAPGAAGAELDTEACRPPAGGSERLCAVWRDPDFDAQRPALYYARVLELPTCRWSTLACNAAAVDCARPDTIGPGDEPCCDPQYPRATRERAWSSPIWYQP
jgi:hypothetical protein